MHFKGFFNKGVFFKWNQCSRILVSSTRMTWHWLFAIAGKALSFIREARNAKHAGRRCVTDSDIPSPSVSARRPLLSETGRSMIEMLGVLAIIGVLSIAAVAGYRFALLKFRANEVTNELNMRAINVSAQMLNTGTVYEKNELIEDGFGDTLTVGFPVETAISDRNTDYFEILVSDIPADLCRQILRDYENPIMIFVNNVRYNADTTICDDETQNALNDMGFIYKNDLGTHEACSEKGYFDEEDFQCHCSGNTYLDIYTNDCLCHSGYIWSAAENTCIESICPEGEFLAPEGCVPCGTPGAVTINNTTSEIALCNACPNRFYNAPYAKCLNKNACSDQQVMDMWGSCHDCSKDSDILLGNSTYSSFSFDQCAACNSPYEREIIFGAKCIIKNKCELGAQFHYEIDGGGLPCASCDAPGKRLIARGDTIDSEAKKYCEACKNADGVSNRAVSGRYCIKVVCDSGEFMGSDGQCHLCTETAGVTVGDNSALVAGCTAESCGRVVENGVCVLDCPQDGTHLKTASGACYPCTQGTAISGVTADECAQCTQPSRFMLTDTICALEGRCKEGSSYYVAGGSYCGSCAADSTNRINTSERAKMFCENCSTKKRHVFKNFCVPDDQCDTGTQFLGPKDWTGIQCYDCTFENKVSIGTGSKEQDQCISCTTQKRFWIGEYCYRCDSAETPEVTTPEEEDSCYSCKGVRVVKDGKCVTVQ